MEVNHSAKKHLFGLKNWLNFIQSINHLLFPETCLICQDELSVSSTSVCSICSGELLFTHFEKYTDPTDLDKLFWGRIQLTSTFAMLFFEKGKSTQKILHALKYQSRPAVGIEFGKMIGEKIKGNELFSSVDLIVPVPIHPKKKFIRGYNQSEQIAIGISTALMIPISNHFLEKINHTKSQTKKGRFARWDNVAQNFTIQQINPTTKHILIVDDVITTGATLEALVRSIQEKKPELRISIVCLAITK
jgi:ComF family protein